MKFRILKIAEAELDEAIRYYENQEPGLGMRFLGEVSHAFGRIMEFPIAYPAVRKRTRRCIVATFPYSILYNYTETPEQFLVVAIAHLQRQPNYWYSRRE